MKKSRLLTIIREELNNDPNSKPIDSTGKLRTDLVTIAKSITNTKGLQPNEIELISKLLRTVLDLSSKGNASAILNRISSILDKSQPTNSQSGQKPIKLLPNRNQATQSTPNQSGQKPLKLKFK